MGDSFEFSSSLETIKEKPADSTLTESVNIEEQLNQPEDKDQTIVMSNTTTPPKLTAEDFKKVNERFNLFQVVKIQVPKLEHTLDSYRNWSLEFAASLRFYKIWSLINRDWEDAVLSDPDWQELNDTILNHMRRTTSEYYNQMIRNDKSAVVAWKKLKSHFEGTPLVQSIRLMKQLAEMIVHKKDDVEEIIVDFKNLLVDMKEQFGELHPNLLIGTLMTVLPEPCNKIVKRVMATDAKADMTVDKVITMVMDEQQLNREQESQKLKSTLNAIAPKQFGQPKYQQPKRRKIICFYCQNEGHAMAVCEQRISDEKSGKLSGKILINKRTARSGASNESTETGETKAKSETAAGGKQKKHVIATLVTANSYDLDPEKTYLDTGSALTG